MKKLDKSSKAELEALISRVKKYLLTPEGKSAIGKLIEEPKIEYPDDEKIKNIYNNNLSNTLQDSDFLNNSQIEDLKKEVLIHLQNERNNRNWALISLIQSMLIPIQKQIQQDIRNDPFEMITVGQTLLVSNYFLEYNKLKNKMKQIKSLKIKEVILYHGSRLANH